MLVIVSFTFAVLMLGASTIAVLVGPLHLRRARADGLDLGTFAVLVVVASTFAVLVMVASTFAVLVASTFAVLVTIAFALLMLVASTLPCSSPPPSPCL